MIRKVAVTAALIAALCLIAASVAYGVDAGVTQDAKITVPASQPAVIDEPIDPNVAKNTDAALDQGKQTVEYGKTKQWFAMSAGIIWLLMFLFKTARKKLNFMQSIPKRVLWIVLPLLSVAAMLLAKFQGDLSWAAAVGVLTSGPAVAFLNDFVKRGLLNKEPSPMRPS